MQYEKEINSGLKKASKQSRRDGKWANPPEVRNESSVPRSTNVRIVLDQLVKENRAEKKRGELLYRPTGGGAGGFGNALGGYRSPDGYDRTPGGDERSVWDYGDETTPTSRGDEKGGSDTSKTTEDTVKAAVGTMIVGGMMPSSGGGTSYR